MRPLQRMAWFNLVVIALIMWAFLISIPLAGQGAARGTLVPLVALVAFGIIFLRRKKGEAFWDERDREIERQSSLAGLWVFFMYFIAFGIFIMLDQDQKPIERHLFTSYFFFGILLFLTVQALAALVLYGTNTEKSGGLSESLRLMTKLQKESLLVLMGVIPIQIAFLWAFPVMGRDMVKISLGLSLFLVSGIAFIAIPAGMTPDESDERDEAIGRRARRISRLGIAITAVVGDSCPIRRERSGRCISKPVFSGGLLCFHCGDLDISGSHSGAICRPGSEDSRKIIDSSYNLKTSDKRETCEQ